MSERDIRNRLAILFQQLELMNLYKEGFVDRLGKKGYDDRINIILDEIIKWRQTLKGLNN